MLLTALASAGSHTGGTQASLQPLSDISRSSNLSLEPDFNGTREPGKKVNVSMLRANVGAKS